MLETINWPVIGIIMALSLFLGFALTFRRPAVSRRSLRGLDAGMQEPLELAAEEASMAPAVAFSLPFLPKKDGPRTMEQRAAVAEVKLHQFLNPADMATAYSGYKRKAALAGLLLALPIAVIVLINGSPLGFLTVPIFALLGYSIPMMMLGRVRKSMEKEVISVIPDFLGYMSAFVTPEAELVRPIEMVLDTDEENADNILYASLRESMRELSVGGSFYESMQEQANLLGVDEWKSVVFMINQARQVAGKSVVEIIREVEADFREERKLRMEMEASKVTTKMSTISSLLLVPTIYCYTMAPAYLQLFSTPGFM